MRLALIRARFAPNYNWLIYKMMLGVISQLHRLKTTEVCQIAAYFFFRRKLPDSRYMADSRTLEA